MKVSDAAVCCECDTLVEITEGRCPCCTSTVLLPLAVIVAPLNERGETNVVRMIDACFREESIA